MKKHLLLLLFLTSLAKMSIAQTQRCQEFNQILRNLQHVYSNNLLDSALLQVRYLRACTPNDEVLANEWTQKIFDKIKQQNLEAKTAQNRAEESEKKANAALNRAKRLVSYFNFGNEDAGWVYQNGRFAAIDREGNQLTAYIYSTPDTFSNGIAFAGVNGQFVFLDYKGKEITKRYDFVAQQSNDFYFAGAKKRRWGGDFEENNQICICQVTPNKPIKDKEVNLNVYRRVLKLNEHLFLAQTEDSLWVRLNERGCQTGNAPYKELNFYYGRHGSVIIAVKVDSLWGFIDSLEQWVIRPQFKGIPSYAYDAVAPDSLGEISDSLINLVIPLEFDNVFASNNNYLIPARKDSLWGYVDKLGHWRIQPQYSASASFQNGVARVCISEKGDSWRNRKWGIIDTTGKIIIPVKYHNIIIVQKNGLAWVEGGECFSLVDSIGRNVDSIPYREGWMSWQNSFLILPKIGDSIILVFSDGRIIHWLPNEGIKRMGYEYDKMEIAIKKGGTWYYADTTGVHDSEIHLWDSIYFEQNGIARVCKNKLWGLSDSTGRWIVEPRFMRISNFENGLARIQSVKDSLWGVINTTGKILVELKFEEIDIDNFDNSITFRKGKLWGYSNFNKQIYIEPQFNEIQTFNDEGALAIVRKDALWGSIDIVGRIIMDYDIGDESTTVEVEPKYAAVPQIAHLPGGYISPFSLGNGLTKFCVNELWGIRDSTGQVVLEPQFKKVYDFDHGLCRVQKDSLWGYINSFGNVVVEPQFNETYGFEHGLAPVRKDSLWGYIDTSGKVVVEPQFNETYAFRYGLAPVQKGSLGGYIDTTGRILMTPQFDFAGSFKNGIAWVKKNALWGVLGTTGNFLIEPQYSNKMTFSNGLVAVQKGNLWGLVDRLGHLLIEPQFNEIKEFGEGWSSALLIDFGDEHTIAFQSDKKVGIQSALILIRKDNQMGLIDSIGQIVLPLQFDRIEKFENGFAKVEQLGRMGLIDIQFNLVLPCEYSNLHRVSINNYMTEHNGRYGLFNYKNDILISPEYETFGFSGEEFGWVRAKKNGKWGWVDQHGEVKIPFRYDASMPFQNGKSWVLQEPYGKFFEINREGKMITY